MKKIEIKLHDVTLREGDQAPLTSFNKKEKQALALMLNELGVSMEVGFGASRADYENILSVKKLFSSIPIKKQSYLSSLGRTFELDTKKSLEVLSGYKNSQIHIFISTPDNHINSKFFKNGNDLNERRKWVLEQIKNEVSRAKLFKDTKNKNLKIEFSPEAASDNAINNEKVLDLKTDEFDFLIKSIETAIISGAEIINIPDTVGNLLPEETQILFSEVYKKTNHLKNKGYNFEFSCHIHNDLALATANAIGAIRGGATIVELTVSGIGERAGNTNLSEIIGIITEKGKSIMLGSDFEGYEVILSGIETKLIGPITRFTEKILRLNKSYQSPFVGLLCDKDGSGVHNASSEVYGGSKDKNKYGGAKIEEFFSPRGGANQILKMLNNFGIEEDKKSEIIGKITNLACSEAEITKAIYVSNIFAMYLKIKGDFEIKNITINKKEIELLIKLQNKEINLKGIGYGENGVIDGIITAINSYIGKKDFIKIIDITVVNKECLHDLINEFLNSVSNLGVILDEITIEKLKEIGGENDKETSSKQVGVSHVSLEVGGKQINSVSYGNDVVITNIKAILEGCLFYL